MDVLRLTLPWAPTVNSYYKSNGAAKYLSPKAKAFKDQVAIICKSHMKLHSIKMMTGRVRLELYAYPPDRRRRDLDNICKLLMDSLESAEVFVDDSQVDELFVKRENVDSPHGHIDVVIREI